MRPFQKERSPFELCPLSLLLPLHLFLSLLPLPPLCLPMELLHKFPVRWCWQALPILATAGSLWKSIARYCWNNNHSNRSCKYLWDGNTGPLCQPKLISRRRSCSWRIIPPCFTVTAISSFIWNFYVFFHSAAISVSTSLGCMVWETADIDVTVLFSLQTVGAG